jgi:hypothetical protein
MRKVIVAFHNYANSPGKEREENKWRDTRRKSAGSCHYVLQLVLGSFRFGSFSHVLVTFSYSSNTNGSLSVPGNQSPSTLSDKLSVNSVMLLKICAW